ncbi:MAG: OadG family protein [Candidatus Gastranaerophilales bacterium]|nr:OadG family protein [Candidatus Gastranaerophilales bacterium]
MADFAELFNTGITITFIGMTVVLAFLTLMIYAMNITSSFIINVLNKYFPEAVKEEPKKAKKKASSNNEEIALGVALAFHAQQGGK